MTKVIKLFKWIKHYHDNYIIQQKTYLHNIVMYVVWVNSLTRTPCYHNFIVETQ